MTIICAMHEPGVGTWIGSDTQTSFGSLKHRFGPKWIISPCGKMALGLSGLSRVRHVISGLPDLFADDDPRRVASAMKAALKDDGWTPKAQDGESGSFSLGAIFATADGYHGIASDLTVMPPSVDGYWADGSGEQFALGAAFVGSHAGMAPQMIVTAMVEAAMTYDTGCGGETFVHLLEAA